MSDRSDTWTILRILEWTTSFLTERGSESPRLDAELLLGHVLDLERIHLYTQFDRPLIPEELAEYRALIKRRAAGEPVAYLTGERAFWTLDLLVDGRVLIPRPDTETLVEAALSIADDSPATVIDVGTGSGAIALALASERPTWSVIATDVSEDALEVARENRARTGLDERVEMVRGHLLEPVKLDVFPIDMVVSNPPYVAESERDEVGPGVLEYEPTGALFAGPDGLDVITELVPAAFDALRPGGYLLVEMGYRQGPAVTAIFEEAGFVDVSIRRDLGGRDRVVSGRRPEPGRRPEQGAP